MDTPTHLLLIAGRSGVGKSSVGNEIHHQLFERGVMHGFIEGDNLDMAFPIPWADRLAERNLAAMWANYQALGHTRLVYTNTVSVLVADDLKQTLGGDVQLRGVLLTATDDSTRERLGRREMLEAESPACVTRVSTDGRAVTDIASEIIETAGW